MSTWADWHGEFARFARFPIGAIATLRAADVPISGGGRVPANVDNLYSALRGSMWRFTTVSHYAAVAHAVDEALDRLRLEEAARG